VQGHIPRRATVVGVDSLGSEGSLMVESSAAAEVGNQADIQVAERTLVERVGVPTAAAEEDGIAGHSQVVGTSLVGVAAPAAAMVAGIVVVEEVGRIVAVVEEVGRIVAVVEEVGRIVAVVVSVVLVECAGEMAV
jgi:homoserine acetyltransferase